MDLSFPLAFGHREEEEIFVALDEDDDQFSVYSATDWRIEPPVSVPVAAGASAAATAAAEPPELPPVTRSVFQGFFAVPK